MMRLAKAERDAILLVHNYQPPGIRDIADNTGDSPELSRAAATMDGDVIIFCGVNIMAETATILLPKRPFSSTPDMLYPFSPVIGLHEMFGSL